MKTVWRGMLSFGMVNIPIALYNATRKKSISFKQLRKSDFSRISYKKVANDGEEVPQTEIAKGYEIAPDRYVVISDAELEAITPKASRVIDIQDFVKLNQIDPRHYDSSYYLAPEPGAGKAYALLLEALKQSDAVGIARFVLRSKEYLAAIRPVGEALTLSTMLFADEIVPVAELAEQLPDVQPSEKELAMAKLLIESQLTEFEPEKYKNEYHAAVMALIDGKAEQEAVISKPAAQGMPAIDIMAAIEASLAALKKDKPKTRAKKKNPA